MFQNKLAILRVTTDSLFTGSIYPTVIYFTFNSILYLVTSTFTCRYVSIVLWVDMLASDWVRNTGNKHGCNLGVTKVTMCINTGGFSEDLSKPSWLSE